MRILKKRTPLTRRNVLKNTAALAIAAPAFRLIEDANAQASSPARMINYFSCNGPMNECGPAEYGGDRTGGNFNLNGWWDALTPHKDVGIFMSHMVPTNSGPNSMKGHSAGGQAFDGFLADNYSADGPSIHHVIGRWMTQQGKSAKEESVVWGLTGGGVGRNAFTTGKDRPVNPELDPDDAWAQIFAGFVGGNVGQAEIEAAKERMRRKQSILDFVKDDCNRLTDALGADGMNVLEAHCTKIRETENNLISQINNDDAPTGGSCAAIDKPAAGGNPWQKAVRFNDLMVAALSCELTHIIAFQTSGAGGFLKVPGVNKNHHAYTHDGNSNTKYNSLKTFQDFYCRQVADLTAKLKKTNDIYGNPLIDSTALLWKSELGGYKGSGNIHPESCCPEILLGGGSKFAHNKYIRGVSENMGKGGADFVAAGKNAAQTLLAMKHHMGMKTNEVGVAKNLSAWGKLYS